MLPGTVSAVPGVEAALDEAEKIGYPVILKAAAGGGGRGIQIMLSSRGAAAHDVVRSCS